MKPFFAVAVLVAATNVFAAGEPMKPEAIKPNALLETAFKDAPGNWVCRGTWTNQDGKAMTLTSQGKITKTLNGHQYVGEFRSPKTKEMPAMKSTAEWHYDPMTKGLVSTMVCDSGDASRSTSSGMQGQSIIWTGEGTMMGEPMKMRNTHTIKGPKEMSMVHEVEKDGAWTKAGEETCRKN